MFDPAMSPDDQALILDAVALRILTHDGAEQDQARLIDLFREGSLQLVETDESLPGEERCPHFVKLAMMLTEEVGAT